MKHLHEIPEEIINIAVEIKRQYDYGENRHDAKPIFLVFSTARICIPDNISFTDRYLSDMDEVKMYVVKGDFDSDWFKEKIDATEYCKEHNIDTKRIETINTQLTSVFEALFFTESAARNWILANSHNLNNPFVYVVSAGYMSKGIQEIEKIFDFLIGVAEAMAK